MLEPHAQPSADMIKYAYPAVQGKAIKNKRLTERWANMAKTLARGAITCCCLSWGERDSRDGTAHLG